MCSFTKATVSLLFLGALESLEVPPLLRFLKPPAPRPRGLVQGLPGLPVNISLSLLLGQDCENYITLLERKGEGLLICGTNARRPSCWNLVRRPLLVHLFSSLLSGCTNASVPSMLGRSWEDSEAGLTSCQIPGGMGTLAGKLVPLGSNGHGILHCLTLLCLPQVNGTVESLGEKRGYAPFSPDENSLVLFDGRTAALGRGWGGWSALCPVAQVCRWDFQEPCALTRAPPPHAQGMKCTPQSGSRNTTGRSLASAASRVRSSCTPVIPSCKVSQALAGLWGLKRRECPGQ